MKAHIFLIVNPKFQLQIICSFGDITKSVKLNGIFGNNSFCIFIIVSSPGVPTFFCLWRVNKKQPQGETSQNAFQRSRSINQKWKICMLEWAYPPLNEVYNATSQEHEKSIARTAWYWPLVDGYLLEIAHNVGNTLKPEINLSNCGTWYNQELKSVFA